MTCETTMAWSLAASDSTLWTGGVEPALRAALVYLVALALVRMGTNRLMGRATAFDMILAFILGSLFSRAINGTASLVATVVSGAMLVLIHWLVAAAARRWEGVETAVKGRYLKLIENGALHDRSMQLAELSERDLYEALRLHGPVQDVDSVALACLERNGQISVLRRREPHVIGIDVRDGVQTVRIELR